MLPVIPPGFIVQLPDGSPERATLPVAVEQVGWVIMPTAGAPGVAGWPAITIFEEAAEMHPAALVTVKLCVPVASPAMVVVIPLPVIVPGLIVQLPAGSPERTTLPVEVAQVGCVMAPAVGEAGIAGWAVTVAVTAADIQVLSDVLRTSIV